MGWQYGNMMGLGSGVFAWGQVIFIIVLVDLILLGVWLWRQITKK